MKHSFTKPGVMIGFKDVSEYIYNNFFEGISIHHPTSMLNSDIIRNKLDKPPITRRCFVKINENTWLWIVKTEQTHIKFKDKIYDIKNTDNVNEFYNIVMVPFLADKEVKCEWQVQMHGIRLKQLENDGGLYFDLNDDDILHKCYFNETMDKAKVSSHPNTSNLWLKGVYKDNEKWEFNLNQIKMPQGLNLKILALNTDLWFISLQKFQIQQNILCFMIPTSISYDGCQYSQKGKLSVNMFARPLSPLVCSMPSFNLSINLQKNISNELSVINYHFPNTNNFLTHRKLYTVHRAFISDDLIHPSGRKWVDIYIEESKKPFENMTETQKQIFPRGRFVTKWNFNSMIKGIVADCVFCYYLPSLILDDADRFKAIGGKGSRAIANMKYGFNRTFKFKKTTDYLCHYSNTLNDKVLCNFLI